MLPKSKKFVKLCLEMDFESKKTSESRTNVAFSPKSKKNREMAGVYASKVLGAKKGKFFQF